MAYPLQETPGAFWLKTLLWLLVGAVALGVAYFLERRSIYGQIDTRLEVQAAPYESRYLECRETSDPRLCEALIDAVDARCGVCAQNLP